MQVLDLATGRKYHCLCSVSHAATPRVRALIDWWTVQSPYDLIWCDNNIVDELDILFQVAGFWSPFSHDSGHYFAKKLWHNITASLKQTEDDSPLFNTCTLDHFWIGIAAPKMLVLCRYWELGLHIFVRETPTHRLGGLWTVFGSNVSRPRYHLWATYLF